MFDIGWPELLVIAVVALVVIGPKDLPKVLHTIGKWTRKARMLTREFQSGIDEMVREAELDDVKKQAQALRKMDLKREVERTVDPTGTIKEAMAPPKVELPGPERTVGGTGEPAATAPESDAKRA